MYLYRKIVNRNRYLSDVERFVTADNLVKKQTEF